jgi:hypothetical protein
MIKTNKGTNCVTLEKTDGTICAVVYLDIEMDN